MTVTTVDAVSTPFRSAAIEYVDAAPVISRSRFRSLDAYRGLIILLCLAGDIFSSLAGDPKWGWLAAQNQHSDWIGCTCWDLIQPAFEFVVGAAMSLAFFRRVERGDSWGRRLGKVMIRATALTLVGLFLDRFGDPRIQTGFMRCLPQIAFGYFVAFFVVGRSLRLQAVVAAGILVGFNLLWMFNPWNGPAGPWAMSNENIGSAFDCWMTGHYYPNLYVGMNAIPATANVIFGVMAGQLIMKGLAPWKTSMLLLFAGVGGIALGIAVNPWLPMIKHIWTASFAIFSGGCTTLILLFFYLVIEGIGWRRWAFPLVVVGANAITAYVASNLLQQWFLDTVGRTWILWLRRPTGEWDMVIEHVYFACVAWAGLFILYRRRIFLRI